MTGEIIPMPPNVQAELERSVKKVAEICRAYCRYEVGWQVEFGEPPTQEAEAWWVRAVHIRCRPRELPPLTPLPEPAQAGLSLVPASSPADRR
jgi:hypothetical protein